MKNLFSLLYTCHFVFLIACQPKATPKESVLNLHPENPHYFLYQGKPTILVTSGEHYGAVMNRNFNFEQYLTTLKKDGLNYTRIFIGPYSEMGDNIFGISNNTMNPKPESWLTPWVKDTVIGKYDLNKWNEDFFKRIKSFVGKASENGIIVEVTLFTSYYAEHQWSNSPYNPKNNIQDIDSISFSKVNTLNNGKLLAIQEQYVRKIVRELNEFGNITFEIQNEPWPDNPQFIEKIPETDTLTHPFAWQKIVETANSASDEWQRKLSAVIVDEEKQLPKKHLIARNISNFRNKIENPDPIISIFNFHYAYPEAASQNQELNKVIGLDETGFMPHDDYNYRSQAWKFMLAGGALYNNLDYSFTVGSEDGTHVIDAGTPGWGGTQFREQLKILKDFLESYQFIKMKPENSILQVLRGNITGYQVLAEKGKQYAIYIENPTGATIQLQLPDGTYRTEWINPITGILEAGTSMTATDGELEINCPPGEDYALKVRK